MKDREAQRVVIHGVTRRWTQLRDNNSKISLWMKMFLAISKRRTLQSSSQQPLPTMHPKGVQEKKTGKLALDSSGIYQRSDFSEPRLLHLALHRKGTKCINFRFLAFLEQ